jgi:hypothetical protein
VAIREPEEVRRLLLESARRFYQTAAEAMKGLRI